MGARINAKKLFIVNPGTIIEASHSNIPFRTNENNPKVMKVIGRDKTCRIGLTKALTKPMTIAASNPKESWQYPHQGRSYRQREALKQSLV